MVAYRDCKGHLVCMADAQTGIVEIQHKDRALRMTVPVGNSFTVTLRDTETVMTQVRRAARRPGFSLPFVGCAMSRPSFVFPGNLKKPYIPLGQVAPPNFISKP